MGLSCTTLLLYRANRSEIQPMLDEKDVIRSSNLPWTVVLPGRDEEDYGLKRMQKLAKKISGQETTALLFNYFDDDCFWLDLFQNGKKVASLKSFDSWNKMVKPLCALLESERPKEAFKWVKHCTDLDEQITLLEETLGVALCDVPEDEERTVSASTRTADEIKKRVTALKKRPNAYELLPVEREKWPSGIQTRAIACEMLRESHPSDAAMVLFGALPSQMQLLGHPEMICFDSWSSQAVLCNTETGEIKTTPSGKKPDLMGRAVWLTKQNELVLHTECPGTVGCVGWDGSARWTFAPSLGEHQALCHAHTALNGTITLYTRLGLGKDEFIWQINGEDGAVLRKRVIPAQDQCDCLRYIEGLNQFMYWARESNDVVLLSAELEPVARFPFGEKNRRSDYGFRHNQTTLCDQDTTTLRSVDTLDLRTGEYTHIPLEFPYWIKDILPDGSFASIPDRSNGFTLIDRQGRVASQHRMKGILEGFERENGQIYAVEIRGYMDDMFYSQVVPEKINVFVWRLARKAEV